MSRILLLALAGLLPATRPAIAQRGAPRDLLVLIAGADTFSLERYRWSPDGLESEVLIRPASARFNFRVHLTPQGTVDRFDMSYRQAQADPSSPPLQDAAMRFTGDSVIADMKGGGRSVTQRMATRPGAVPYLNPSMTLAELLVRRARAQGRAGDSTSVLLFNVQGGNTISADVVRIGHDSVRINLGNVMVRLALDEAGHVAGGIIPSQNIRIVRMRGAGDASGALTVPRPDYSAPAGAPYTSEDVQIPTPGGFMLAGTLTIPTKATRPSAAIVTITGSGLEDRDEALPIVRGYRPFRQIADTLGRSGIAVLRVDDRGFGASGGDPLRATSADFADDVRAALAYLRTRSDIDHDRLGLLGHSEGGLIAPMVAASDSSLRAIVLMAGPSRSGRRIIEYQLRFAIDHNAQLSVAQRDSAYRTIPATIDSAATQPWMRFFLEYDPLPAAKRVKAPTLILQGANDRQVTFTQAEELAAALRAGGNRDVTVHVFERANHLFTEDADGNPAGYPRLLQPYVRSDVLGTVVDWLRDKLR